MKRISLDLQCDLTRDELLARAQELSAVSEEYELCEARKREAMKDFREELEGLRQRRLRLSRVISTQTETRTVECAVLFHSPVQGTKRITRLDTGDHLRDEPMTLAELQIHLFGNDRESEAEQPTETEAITEGDTPTGVEPEPEPEQPVAD